MVPKLRYLLIALATLSLACFKKKPPEQPKEYSFPDLDLPDDDELDDLPEAGETK